MPADDHTNKSLALLSQGQIATACGDYKQALTSLLEAFSLSPGNRDIQYSLFDILSCTDGYELPPAITKAIALVAKQGRHDIQALAMLVRNQFDCSDEIEEIIASIEKTEPLAKLDEDTHRKLTKIFQDPLVALILAQSISISPEIEDLLTALRKFLLEAWAAGNLDTIALLVETADILPLIASQTFNTQYVFNVTEAEKQQFSALSENLSEAPLTSTQNTLALYACYEPLHVLFENCEQESIDQLTEEIAEWPDTMCYLWRQQVLEPRYELLIQPKLQTLTSLPANEPGSVREQYENFPYPRWQTQRSTPPVDLHKYLTTIFDAAVLPNIQKGPVDILFAGCGTEKQVVSLGNAISSKNMLAFDISAASLSYAYRKAQEHEITNAHFVLADVTQIGNWDASFDFIVCTGVLHHLENISAGLIALQNISKDNSVMFLALYSLRGRKAAIAARKYITQNQIDDTQDNIRAIREKIKALPFNHPVAPVQESQEFYSASGLHDYIFNKQEANFTPSALKELLESHCLRFIGFQNLRGDTKQKYLAQFPNDPQMTDLENWEIFEQDNEDIFGEMMQFWCCKAI